MSALVKSRLCTGFVHLIPPETEIAIVRYVSSNRVKPFKKIEITDRARNEAKAQQVRTEIAEQEKHGESLVTPGKMIQSVGQSLSSKGYLRSAKPYMPPDNVEQEILKLAQTANIKDSTQAFADQKQKFEFLSACFAAFKHSVPNSQLHEIKTIEDTIQFYQSPIDTTLPLDALKTVQLPENLHIQHEYIRFHPETDTMFGGRSAFPKSSTIVTGLRYKDKYKGHVAKKSWP
ncbi:39S ribosomal protein L50, mitochondrial [Uranotaenia lowii]|uniref:39S ribosomal protein L50, mitochondrial n=1 Tax=Uranotaenia lowii TaxID=190385 RepID=UPI002479A2A9|nr:39S ribosomal protein L50, mitochondrial [Uranotaenia lowii]